MGVEHSQLGKETVYDHPYDPGLLFPIARSDNRAKLDLNDELPFQGEDLWTCFELSWLDQNGKPHVAIADFRFPCDSPYMIESKSFKLYLNSLNHHRFSSEDELVALLKQDLSAAAQAPVKVAIKSARQPLNIKQVSAVYVDDIEIDNPVYQPDAGLLKCVSSGELVSETLCSELLRSNCPVTGQPDWGTVYVQYKGQAIDHESMLRYIVSFRQCQDFHEHCVERIFTDILAQCHCEALSVYARYTRRGGLDINPIRSTEGFEASAPDWRTARQ